MLYILIPTFLLCALMQETNTDTEDTETTEQEETPCEINGFEF